MNCRGRVAGTSLILVSLLFISSNAQALVFFPRFLLNESELSNGVTFDGGERFDWTEGDVLAIQLNVNPPGDYLDVSSISLSLVYDSTKVEFLSGERTNILLEFTCLGFLCRPQTLLPLEISPFEKSDSPLSMGTGTEGWIQALDHIDYRLGGTENRRPTEIRDGALVFFRVMAGVDPRAQITFDVAFTGSDSIQTISGDPLDFVPVIWGPIALNPIPEPSTTLLLGFGLIGLASSRQIRRRVPAGIARAHVHLPKSG